MTFIDQIDIFFFKEEDGDIRVSTMDRPFEGISAFGDTKLEALKEFCTAMIGAIEVLQQDENKCECHPHDKVYYGCKCQS